MKSWLYNVLIGILLGVSVYFGYNYFITNNKNQELQEQLLNSINKEIAERRLLIDSITKSTILIKKEILENDKYVLKLKQELKNTKVDSLTYEEAKKILGL